MSAPRREARDYPFTFGDLSLDRKMKIGVSLSPAKDVCFGALNSHGMPLAVVDFFVFGRNEILYGVHFPRVDDLLIEATHQSLVFVRMHSMVLLRLRPKKGDITDYRSPCVVARDRDA